MDSDITENLLLEIPEIVSDSMNETIDDSNVLKFKSSSADFDTKLWVVASGKGGVGKTFVASSVGITLSKLGHSVVIIDLDLSGATFIPLWAYHHHRSIFVISSKAAKL